VAVRSGGVRIHLMDGDNEICARICECKIVVERSVRCTNRNARCFDGFDTACDARAEYELDPGGRTGAHENLIVEGVPPIPQSLAEQADRYTTFRSAFFASWHPTKREMKTTASAKRSMWTTSFTPRFCSSSSFC